MMKPLLIAITGGIGSGKSVVANMLTSMGYKVYDCDSRAKEIIAASDNIKDTIRREICADAFDSEGNLDRRRLAAVVFNNRERLNLLNSIVHSEVKDDIRRWADANSSQNLLFIETAILYESGLDREVDYVIEVVADERVRILRVMRRSGLSAEEVCRRIESQNIGDYPSHYNTFIIDNDGVKPVLPRLLQFLASIS